MADTLRLPSPVEVSNPASFDAWYRKLPPDEQRQLLVVVGNALKNLTRAQRHTLVDVLGAEALNRSRNGLGSLSPTSIASIGAIVGGLAQAGVSLYTASQNQDMAKELAKRQAQTATAIADMQNEAAVQIAKIQNDALIEAARQGGAAQIASAGYASTAAVGQTALRWQNAVPLALTVGGVAAVAGIGYLIIKKKRSRR